MENVNIIVGRFQPFTLGHTKGAEQVYKEYKLRTVFLIVNTPKSKVDLRHPFESEQIIKDNCNCGEDWFAGMFGIQNADIGKIATVCRDNGFEPVMWTCGTDRFKPYSMQASEKYINMYNLSPEFKVNEIKRTDDDISASAVRQALKDGDQKTFEKMMPKWIWNKFNIYKSIVSAVKESKSLSSFIKESIYGNLGIDLSDCVKEWVHKYNKQKYSNALKIGDDGRIYNEYLDPLTHLYIYSNDLLENGKLPAYLNFCVDKEHLSIHIEANGLKSFDNFPEVKYLNLTLNKVQIKDFRSLTCCKYVSIDFEGCTPVIHNLKSKIVVFADTVIGNSMKTSIDTGSVWKNMKGCTFDKVEYTDYGESITFPQISIKHLDDNKRNANALNEFFKNNKFNYKVAFYCDNTLSDLTFFDGVNCKFIRLKLVAPNIENIQELKTYLKPVIDNADKWDEINFRGKYAKKIIEVLNKILPNKNIY